MPKSSSWSIWKKARSLSPNVDQTKSKGKKHILFFCPSLGEYESIRSLISNLKATKEETFIEVTCFSPSAYQSLTTKITHQADLISYSPIDIEERVTDFLQTRDIDYFIFSSFALWPALTNHLILNNIPYSFVSARVRSGLLKNIYYTSLIKYLVGAEHICVIEQKDATILSNISNDINTVVCGDPRIDSIKGQFKKPPSLDSFKTFCNDHKVIVFGSTHKKDEAIIIPIIAQLINSNYKVIISPHDVHRATSIAKKIESAQLLSTLSSGHGGSILIVDELGWLKHIYSLSDIAYIGGGFSNELHNIIEPLLADNVIITGPSLSKSYIAQKLEKTGSMKTINTAQELHLVINQYSDSQQLNKDLLKSKEILQTYSGATEKIAHLLNL